MPYKPSPGFIMCQPLKKETKTAAGLTLPDSEKERDANIAAVIEVGGDLIIDEQVRLKAPDLVEGDIVAYKQYSDTEVEESFNKIVFVPFEAVVGTQKGIGRNAAE